MTSSNRFPPPPGAHTTPNPARAAHAPASTPAATSAPAPTPPAPPAFDWVKTGNAKADQVIKHVLVWMWIHWKGVFYGMLVFLGIVLVPVFSWLTWMGWQTQLALLITVGLAVPFFRSRRVMQDKDGNERREDVAELCVRRWKALSLLVAVPLVLPITLTLYTVLAPRNLEKSLEEAFHPTRIYYGWSVNEGDFSDEDKKRLLPWNPGKEEEGKQIRSQILLAAKVVGLSATEVTSLEKVKSGETVNAIIFESRSPLKPLPEPAPPPSSAPKKAARLMACFVTFVSPSDKKEDIEATVKAVLARARCKVAKENLDITFEFLAQGFADSTGRPIDLTVLWDEPPPRAQREGPEVLTPEAGTTQDTDQDQDAGAPNDAATATD